MKNKSKRNSNKSKGNAVYSRVTPGKKKEEKKQQDIMVNDSGEFIE